MVTKRLMVNPTQMPMTIDDFVWQRPTDGLSSMMVNIGPYLEDLGTVPLVNREAVWLTAAAFLTDRTVRRPKGWERQLELIIPSAEPDAWSAISDDLDGLLSFLTSDRWKVTVVPHVPESRELLHSDEPEQCPDSRFDMRGSDAVCLFSGGADSVCAAVKALAERRNVTLISHWDFAGHSGIQSRLVNDLRRLFGVDIPHLSVNLGRRKQQPGAGTFPDEPSRRSRSALFIALGLAVASARGGVPLLIGENGFTSLNTPLASERRGAHSTRTTHPKFLRQLRGIFEAVGAHSDFTSPYADMTKGEMFSSVSDTIGQEQASALLSTSHSCAHLRRAKNFGLAATFQCGVCFGCLVRRAAFVASGLDDRTSYLVTDLNRHQRNEFLASKAKADIETMRYAVGRHFGMADILSLDLPDSYDLDGALDLVRRGFRELALVDLP